MPVTGKRNRLPVIGKRYRLTTQVGEVGNFPLEAGLEGEVLAIVPADEDGAGDHEHDCAVIAFDNGRTWSHPIEPVKTALRIQHVTNVDGQVVVADHAPVVGFDDLFEEV